MALRLSTAAYRSLFPAKQSTFPSGMAMGDVGMGAGAMVNAAPELGSAGTAVSSAISDYLEEMTAADQRTWRTRNVWADIAIRQRMDDLRDQEWSVGARNPKKPVDTALVAEIAQFLEAPNAQLENNTFGGLWGAAMNDVYTIGRGVMQKLLNRNLTPRGYRALDAARLRHNPAWDPAGGDTPTSPDEAKRWIFQASFSEKVYFSSPEIIMLVPYESTYDRVGLSPMRALKNILEAELDTRRKMHFTQKYGVPPGAFIMPGAAPGSPEKMRLMYDLKAAGKPNILFLNLPKDSRFQPFGELNLISQGTFQFYEILVKATAASFGTTPFRLGWTDQDSYANSKTQLVLIDRGGAAMLKFVRQNINRHVIGAYTAAYGSRADNIWFTFRALRDAEDQESADDLRKKSGTIGFTAINEVRAGGGLPLFEYEEVGDVLWPFFAEPWVPSRLRGVFLPVSYAAMTWGIVQGMSEQEMVDALMSAAATAALVPAQLPPGSTLADTETDDEDAEDEGSKSLLSLVQPGQSLAARQELLGRPTAQSVRRLGRLAGAVTAAATR